MLGGTSSNRGVALTLNSSGSRGDVLCGGEPYVTLAGPDVVCVRAIFGLPSNAGEGRLSERLILLVLKILYITRHLHGCILYACNISLFFMLYSILLYSI